ncbi:MAG: 4-(cytidine 5'-diphospho)-2-C-methyl-D-erythritol kinase [Actinomycetota bacterium]|nr:4-(cytidine 5'-diphospho)-2-C-methyl-D-erythritol kinase [Actinomycetota bacterium]
MTTVTVRTPAKINLGLSVGPPRADGYHPVATVYQAISLYDEVKARPAPEGVFTISLTGEGRDVVPLDDANLAVQAAMLLAKTFEVPDGAALSVHKTIAVAGGLAGGSTNAAAALVACDALWGLGASRDELAGLAAQLGSDVPFCLTGGTALGSGRGETVSRVLARGSYEWVLAYAEGGLETTDVYAELDRIREDFVVEPPEVSEELMSALRAGDAYALGPALYNDLQDAALRLRPALARTLALGEEYGALGFLIAGSGPTCLFLVAGEDHAVDLAVALSGSGLCRSIQRASGPVPGARLIT